MGAVPLPQLEMFWLLSYIRRKHFKYDGVHFYTTGTSDHFCKSGIFGGALVSTRCQLIQVCLMFWPVLEEYTYELTILLRTSSSSIAASCSLVTFTVAPCSRWGVGSITEAYGLSSNVWKKRHADTSRTFPASRRVPSAKCESEECKLRGNEQKWPLGVTAVLAQCL